MKKSLIALAVMAAAGAASAQSSVQLYGIADVWLGSTKTTVNGSTFDKQNVLESGGINTSRIGLKGAEDLGNGLKATFQLEKAFNVDSGDAASGFDRIATVGLSGGFGDVTFGRNFTAYDDIRGTANNTFDANVSATATNWVGYNATLANTIKYTSPSYMGFSGAVSYALGEDKTTTTSATKVLALNIQYANGPLFVGFAHQKEEEGNLASTAFGNPLMQGFFGGYDWTGAEDYTYNLLTASYDFGVAKLVGSYNQAKANWTSSDYTKASEYQIGVEVPLASNLTLGGGYASSKLKDSGDASSWAKSTGYSTALVYSLSKRTSVYAVLNKSKYVEDGYVEIKSTAYGVGINHKF